MSSEIILITGPAESGKTWLANILWRAYGECAKIWEEPDLQSNKFWKEIKLFTAYRGRAIIVCQSIRPEQIAGLNPDRIITLYTKHV